jgi:hypothetical protein
MNAVPGGLDPDCNCVYLKYGDGASFAGYRREPWPVPGTNATLTFRGIKNLDAGVQWALDHGMSSATELVVGGSSAGGLSVFLHADRIAAAARKRAPLLKQVTAAPDVGFFIDHDNFAHSTGSPNKPSWGAANFTAQMLYIASMQNMTFGPDGGLSPACQVLHPDEPLLCFMAPYVAPTVQTPAFMFNSRFDEFQLGNILQLMNWTTVEQRDAVISFGESFLSQVAPFLAHERNGAFITTCICHGCDWTDLEMDGKTSYAHYAAWMESLGNGTATADEHIHIDHRPPDGGGALLAKCGSWERFPPPLSFVDDRTTDKRALLGLKSDDLSADLLSLVSLRQAGDLSAAEYSTAKQRVLAAPSPYYPNPAEYPTLAALQNATKRSGRANRWGYATAGDGGSGVYAWSDSPCSIDQGKGDGGFQVQPDGGVGCWLLQEPRFPLDTMLWGQPAPIFHVDADSGTDVGGDSSCMLRASPCKTIAQALRRNYMVPWGGTSSSDYISIAPGVYPETVGVYSGRLGPAANWPMITLSGAGLSTVIAGDGKGCATVVANMPGVLNIRNLTLTATANPCQSSIFAQLGGIINVYEGVTFGDANQQDVHAESSGSEVQFWKPYTITGNATYHLAPIRGAEITYNPIVGLSVRLSGARFSGSFVWGADGGQVYVASTTSFIHDPAISETWKPFDLMSGATLDMQGAPLASLPGEDPGYMFNGQTAPWPGPPTVSSSTGIGSGTAAVIQGHDFAGTVELRPALNAFSSGEVALAFNHTLGATSASCSCMAEHGSGRWGSVSFVVIEATQSALKFAWNNSGVRLLSQQTYRIVYQCAATCGYSGQCRGSQQLHDTIRHIK